MMKIEMALGAAICGIVIYLGIYLLGVEQEYEAKMGERSVVVAEKLENGYKTTLNSEPITLSESEIEDFVFRYDLAFDEENKVVRFNTKSSSGKKSTIILPIPIS